jgi:hypothetical protein
MVDHREEFRQELTRIIDQSVELDKEIHKQVARIEWVFPKENAKLDFDPSTMELKRGVMRDMHSRDGQVLVVTAPAVRQQGRSNGEAFYESLVLVTIEISFKRPLGNTHVSSDFSA